MAESAASDALAQVGAAIELMPVPVLVYDIDTFAIVLANAAATALYGWSVPELTAMTMLDLRPDDDADHGVTGALDDRLATERLPTDGEPGEHERGVICRQMRRDGRTMSVEASSTGVVVDGRMCRLLVLRDETTRVRADAERSRSVHRLLDVQEHLHNEIAERLHDGPVQTLTAASLRIGLLRRSVHDSLEPKLAEIERLVIDALHSLRREMDDQRAPLDIASDFAGSIRSVLTRFGLQDHYVVRASGDEPPASVASLLYRLVMRVLSTTSLGADDDPWVIELDVTPSGAIVSIPVVAGSGIEAQLLDWTSAMQGGIERIERAGYDELRLTVWGPPTSDQAEGRS